ncbi:MAG: aldo/keto reductase, partial [Oscillospiraceae bacterium]
MIYKEFSGLQLSTLGMGNMRLPTIGEKGPIDTQKAREILEYAYHHGVNYFDTAYRYHGGESESFVGEVLSQFPRESYFLASKMPGHMMHYQNGKLGFQGYLSDFKCDSVADIFEEQLKKCRVEYFDFYLLHNVCESSYEFYTNEELGVVAYLLEQKEKGRIHHLGFSAHGRAELIDRFLSCFAANTFEFIQLQLNYLDWKLQDAKSKYDVATKHHLPVMVMEPVRGGRLVNLPEKQEKLLRETAPSRSNAAWAFRFLQSLPNVQLVLSGMTTLEQLQENISVFS